MSNQNGTTVIRQLSLPDIKVSPHEFTTYIEQSERTIFVDKESIPALIETLTSLAKEKDNELRHSTRKD